MNVLFIEDDRMNRRVVKDMLDVAGASMVEAEIAELGLRILGEQDFQIVFLTGWSPDPSQPKPARRGSATASLGAALGRHDQSDA